MNEQQLLIATIATQRSGTKAFASLFATGTEITPFGELFNPDVAGPLSFRGFLQSQSLDSVFSQHPDALLDTFFRHLLLHRRKLHFDVMFNQLEFCCTSWNVHFGPYMYGYLRAKQAVVVLLTRNPRDSFQSMLQLKETGIAHQRAFEQANPKTRKVSETLIVDDAALSAYSRFIEGEYDRARSFFSDYENFVEASFEEFSAAQSLPKRLVEVIRRQCSAVGLPFNEANLQLGTPLFRRPQETAEP